MRYSNRIEIFEDDASIFDKIGHILTTSQDSNTRTVGGHSIVSLELTPKSPSARPSVQFYECHIKLGSHQIALRK